MSSAHVDHATSKQMNSRRKYPRERLRNVHTSLLITCFPSLLHLHGRCTELRDHTSLAYKEKKHLLSVMLFKIKEFD